MYSRLLNFIDKHKIINQNQFGFRNNHSTFMALIILVENLVDALDNGKCAGGIVLGFQRVFDTLDHGILLDKLYCHGIRYIAHEWFISYIQIVNNQEWACIWTEVVRCGVLQGSILGPMPFLLFINDLTNVSSFFMAILLLMIPIFSALEPPQKHDSISEELFKTYAWVNANRLSINTDKIILRCFCLRFLPIVQTYCQKPN